MHPSVKDITRQDIAYVFTLTAHSITITCYYHYTCKHLVVVLDKIHTYQLNTTFIIMRQMDQVIKVAFHLTHFVWLLGQVIKLSRNYLLHDMYTWSVRSPTTVMTISIVWLVCFNCGFKLYDNVQEQEVNLTIKTLYTQSLHQTLKSLNISNKMYVMLPSNIWILPGGGVRYINT